MPGCAVSMVAGGVSLGVTLIVTGWPACLQWRRRGQSTSLQALRASLAATRQVAAATGVETEPTRTVCPIAGG